MDSVSHLFGCPHSTKYLINAGFNGFYNLNLISINLNLNLYLSFIFKYS